MNKNKIQEMKNKIELYEDTIRRFKDMLQDENENDVFGLTASILADEIRKLKIKKEKLKEEIVLIKTWKD